MHSKFSINKFTDSFRNTVLAELTRKLEKAPRVTRKDLEDSFEETDRPGVALFITEYLKEPNCPHDSLPGAGGGIGLKGSDRGSNVIHIEVSPELLARVEEKANKILSLMGGPRGFTAQTIAGAFEMYDEKGYSQVVAALNTLVASNKLSQKRGIGYCKYSPEKPPAEGSGPTK